jgi:putative ABC transport system permease protein
METVNIPIFSLGLTFLLLIIPITISMIFGLKLIRPLLYSVSRMAIQLVLIGIFLKYLFQWNNILINISWLMIMIITAIFSAVKNSSLKISKIFIPCLMSFSIATFGVIFYLNIIVIPLDNIFDARYLIVLSGMLLGNSLRGNVIGISTFYNDIKKDTKRYLYVLSLGSSRYEAILPYLKESIQLALKPSIASMATMGIVSLPGMMTGVILGGASPEVAIKYQIMIMIAIITSTIISVVLTILMTMNICFNKYGILQQDIFLNE